MLVCAALAAVGLLALALPAGAPARAGTYPPPPSMTFVDPNAAVPLVERQICSLLNTNTGNGARIAGQDGGLSMRIGDATYWIFGDTMLKGGGDLVPNNIATSQDTDARDCIALQHATGSDGAARPVLPLSADADEATVWPLALVQTGEDAAHQFYLSISTAVEPFTVRFMGLARFDPATLTSTRTGDDPTRGEPFWPASYGIAGAAPLRDGDYVYVFLNTPTGFTANVRLARVLAAEIEDVSAYEYWDGDAGAWSADFARSSVLFAEAFGAAPGAVSWNGHLQRWTMTYTGLLGSYVGMRTSEALAGPWSAPQPLFQCTRNYPGPGRLGTYCYAADEHEAFQRDGGKTLYITIPNEIDYRVFLHEVTLAEPVSQVVEGDGARAYVVGTGSVAGSEGAVFYAGSSPDPLLTPVRRWRNGSDVRYEIASPGAGFTDDGVAFYAAASPGIRRGSLAHKVLPYIEYPFDAVYRWDSPDGSQHIYSPFPVGGAYLRASIAFYARCADGDADGASDCAEAWQGTDPANGDTDGDGHLDRVAPDDYAPLANDVRYDNCPTVANYWQENSDRNYVDLSPYRKPYADITWPRSDNAGDACDNDADNDGLTNAVEQALPGPLCASATAPLDPYRRDTDGDNVLDGAECMLGSNPSLAASQPRRHPPGDTDSDGIPNGFEILFGWNPNDGDTDDDTVPDGVEFKGFGTDPLRRDSDNDGCEDRLEIASINGDLLVNLIDFSQIAQASGSVGSTRYVPPFDVTRDNSINVLDLFFAARQFGDCVL